MVDRTMPIDQALQGRPPPDSEILYGPEKEGRTPYLIEKRVLVAGGDLTDAQPGFDQRTTEPIVQFRFNSSGARKFAQATQENVGRPFAIVLDNEVISAPVIREPILQGSGQISGSFTVQGANDLSVLLRAGALAGQADHHRGAHGRTGPRAGLDREGQARLGGRLADGGGLHAGDLRLVRPVRQCRGRDQCRDDLRAAVAARRHADAAGHRRHRADGRHRGRFQRADLRAHPRGGAQRPHPDHRHRRGLHPGAGHHPGFQHHHLHRRRRAVLHRHRCRCRASP